MTRRLPQMITALLIVVAALALTGSSSASFVSSTSSSGRVSAAADWTPPTVAVTSPGTVVKGSTAITAIASDTGAGVESVTIQRAIAGSSSWVTICVDTATPFTCDWVTTSIADGDYDLRATATDRAGNSTTSAVTRTTVANALTVVLTRPADVLRGTVSTITTISNGGGLTPAVRVEYAPTGTTTWTTLCTVSSAPFTCSASTTTMGNGTYDLRSVATASGSTFTSAVVRGVIVDNLAPTVTMTNPGTPLKGVKAFAATATDAHSGIADVLIQSSTGGAWSDLCTVTTAPFTCSVDTATLANGTYSFRAIATDLAGNRTTSTAVTGRVVQNVVSAVTLTAPSTYLRGTVTLSASATSTGTIASVKVQRSAAGADSWTDICTDTASPYTCSFATAQVGDGTYDLRAVVTDSDGRATSSAVVAGRIVDNTAGRGVDVQTTNGGTAGRIDAGDTIVYTFSEQMNLSSIYAGWSGAATSGTVRVRDGLIYGGGVDNDVLELSSPTGANLGTLNLNENFATLFTISTDITMTATTVTTGGIPRTVVTVRIGTGSIGNQVSSAANMVWNPSATVLDLAGNATSTAAVTESGALDLDF